MAMVVMEKRYHIKKAQNLLEHTKTYRPRATVVTKTKGKTHHFTQKRVKRHG